MLETFLVALVIFLTVVIVQYIIKPLMKEYKDRPWYGLSINIASIIVVMVLAVAILFIDAVSEIYIVEAGVDFIIQIFGAVFVYEVLKNVHKAVRNGKVKNNQKEANES